MVKFSSGIETKVGGAGGDEWEGKEVIGIYMVENGSTTVLERAENIKYTTKSQGSTAEFTSTTPIYYPVSGKKVSFIAYHPYREQVVDYLYPVDVSRQNDQTAIDLLVATADNNGAGYDKIYGDDPDNHVTLDFSHQLAKVVIHVERGDGVATEDLTKLSTVIKGMKTKADFDISDPELAIDDLSSEDLVPFTTSAATAKVSYEAILLPVSLDASHVVEFTVGGNTYKWEIRNNSSNITTFEVGHKYTFNVVLQKNRVLVIGIIEPWVLAPEGNGVAK